MVYVLDRAHDLHFFQLRSMPAASRDDGLRTFIEYAKQMKTITDLPLLLPDLLQSNGLLGQDLREVNKMAVPLNLAVVTHLANHYPRWVLDREHLGVIATSGGPIHTARSLSPQSFMGALPVILCNEPIKTALQLR